MRTGMANLPLHGGKCPPWLFERMKRLGGAILEVIVAASGPEEFLRRLADPFWFQALGCVLGFDWHSSGLTTTVCGALKESLQEKERDFGLAIAGGKGRTSRKAPEEIKTAAARWGSPAGVAERLITASKLAAKVDNAALQDGYQLYHHVFVFTPRGDWAVIQQGMHTADPWARRYHWLGEEVKDFVCEPHTAVCGTWKGEVLNLVARESKEAREVATELSQEKPERVLKEFTRVLELTSLETFSLPAAHAIPRPDYLAKILPRIYEEHPKEFTQLLGIEGVGPKTVRALALVAEVAYGAKPSFRDPVRYSFAHGGKDGHPYPVDRKTYDNSVAILERALREAKIGNSEKLAALKRIATLERKAEVGG